MEKDTTTKLTEERVREIVREEIKRDRAERAVLPLEMILGREGARQWLSGLNGHYAAELEPVEECRKCGDPTYPQPPEDGLCSRCISNMTGGPR